MRNCNCNCNCNRRCNCKYNSCSRNCQNNSNDIYSNICNQSGSFPTNYLYGHAYTPNHTMSKTYTPEIGLQNGTIFPELVSPYCPGQSIDFIEFLRNGGNI